jgi:subtilisin family serine protease
MSKLEPALHQALSVWRIKLGYARSGEHSELSESEIEERRVSVIVEYTGDVQALRDAGLQTGFDSGGNITGLIAFRDLERLEAVPGVIRVSKQPQMKPHDNSIKEMRVPWKVPPTTPWPGKGAGVIVAVVDTGIDIFHDSFRKDGAGNPTRILELWDQTAGLTGGSMPPATFMQQGQVYNSSQINTALAAGAPFQSTDTVGHGTHVAGIAAGNGRQDDRCSFPGHYVGVAPEADLVIVKAIGVTNGNSTDALNWCAQAGSRHGNKAVVINCSFGSDTGPHDGHSASDKRVDDILRPASGPPAGLAIVVSAGNAGRDEIRETGTIPPNGTVTIPFYIPDGSSKDDTLDIWYNAAASLDVEIIAPPSTTFPPPNTTGTVPPAPLNPARNFPIGGMTLTITSDLNADPNSDNKKEINVAITVPPDKSVRSGTWQMKLTETAGVAATWNAWFETEHGDAFPTFRLPDPPRVERRRENTINEPGSSRNAITVASYNDDGGELAESSSRGHPNQPAATPVGEFKPTIAAPGVGVAAARSRHDPNSNSSCCDQKVIDKDGTSMAAPHVTGLVALMLQKNKTLTFEQIRAHLQHSARIDGIPAAEVPPVWDATLNIRAGHLWGSGKVNAAVALAEMPAAPGGGGGGGGTMTFDTDGLGYTPPNLVSRMGDWRNRFGPRPGVMLFASLVSEHVDEVLRLINRNRRVGAVWRRCGGPLLVRRLLYGPPPSEVLLPRVVGGCDMAELLARFIPMLDRFGGPRLKADIARFRDFAQAWPGANLAQLDQAAHKFETGP